MPAADAAAGAPGLPLQEGFGRMNYRRGAAKRAGPPEPTT